MVEKSLHNHRNLCNECNLLFTPEQTEKRRPVIVFYAYFMQIKKPIKYLIYMLNINYRIVGLYCLFICAADISKELFLMTSKINKK